MSIQPLSQAKSAAPLGSESADPVWLGRRGRLNAKDRPLIFNKDGWSRKAVTPKLLAAGEGPGSGAPGPARLIINLAPARGRGHAAQVHEKPSNRGETNLTLADCVAAAYVLASVAFYPATVWFFLS
jgi:hypothetical protein